MKPHQKRDTASRVGWNIIWTLATYVIVPIGFVLLNLRFAWIERDYAWFPGQQIGFLAAALVLGWRLARDRFRR